MWKFKLPPARGLKRILPRGLKKILPRGLRKRLPDSLKDRSQSQDAGRPSDLSEAALQMRSIRLIRRIALIGLVLILADLLASSMAPSVPIVSDGGRLYLVRPAPEDAAGHISLRASVRAGGQTYEDSFQIRLDPRRTGSDGSSSGPAREKASAGENSSEDLIRSELRQIAAGMNEDLSLGKVLLPTRLTGGQTIHWKRKTDSNTILLVMMTAVMIAAVYRSRFQPLRRQQALQQASVRRQLPVFLNELVLLLGAGLVLSRAFTLAAERADDSGNDYFQGGLRQICQSMRNTNGSLQDELQAFARKSGVNELLRLSSIVQDNINKGAELTRKLERESESLWMARKLEAQQRGRLAETKMTLPLSVFLCVLIIITVAPAMLQL